MLQKIGQQVWGLRSQTPFGETTSNVPNQATASNLPFCNFFISQKVPLSKNSDYVIGTTIDLTKRICGTTDARVACFFVFTRPFSN